MSLLLVCAILLPGCVFSQPASRTLSLTPEEVSWIESRRGEPIRWGIDPDWPPVEFRGESGDAAGMSREYVDRIQELTGLQISLVASESWDDTFARLKSGELELLTALQETPERREYLQFTKPYLELPMVIIVSDANPYFNSLKDLAGQEVAVGRGHWIEEALQRDWPDIKLVTGHDERESLVMVSQGKAKAFVGNLATTSFAMRQANLENLVLGGETSYRTGISMGIRKDLTLLHSIVEKALDAIPATEKREIQDKWIKVRISNESPQVQAKLILAMRGRIKELEVIYALTDLVESRAEMEELGQRAAELLPTALQFPEVAAARVTIDGTSWKSAGWQDSHWIMETPITVGGTERGKVELVYTEERPHFDDGPFLKEERTLLEKSGNMFGEVLERRAAEARASRLGHLRYAAAGLFVIFLLGGVWVIMLKREAVGRERSRLALENSERRFRNLVSNLTGVVYHCSPDEKRVAGYVSNGLKEVLGRPADEWLASYEHSLSSLVHPDDVAKLRDAIETALKNRTEYGIIYQASHADGSWRHVFDKGRGVWNDEGVLTHCEGILLDVTAQHEAQRLRREADERLKLITDSMPGVVFQLERQAEGICQFTMMSRAAADVFGIQAEEAVADWSKWRRTLHPEESELFLAVIEWSSQTGEGIDCELRLASDGNAQRWIRCIGHPTIIANSRQCWSGVFTDITRSKLIEQELADARDVAEEATQAKAQFLATMSHEIRTPMNAIINMTALTLDSALTRKQEQYLRTVSSSARGLLALINDILDFSKIEAGRLEIDHVAFRLPDLLEEIADTFRDRVMQKNVEFVVHRDIDVPANLTGDVHRLRQVLLNLVGNAFKFTEVGQVVLRISLASGRVDEKNVSLQFKVRDTGIGIAEDKIGRLFQSFSQVDSSTARKYGGTGLGLAICLQLVRLMGGAEGIKVTSQPGRGSEFAFTLPFEVAEGPPEERALPAALAGREVLVVEDNETSSELIQAILSSFGLKPVAVGTAELGLDKVMADTSRFGALVLDWRLPGMSGLELLRLLRKRPETVRLPIVLTSSFAGEAELSELSETEAAAFAAKPIKPSSLLDALMEAAGAGTIAGIGAGGPGAQAIAPNALAGAVVLLAEDNEANQFVARELMEPLGIRLEIATDGYQALQRGLSQEHHLILMDIQMPGMDGLEATRQLRQQGRTIPIIAMTANAMQGDEEACLDAGMNDYVAKPIDRNQLYAALRRWLPDDLEDTDAVVQEESSAVAPPPVQNLKGLTGINVAGALRRLGLPEASYIKLLHNFQSTQGATLAKLRDGVARTDFDAVRMHAHSLAGASGNIGAEALHSRAKALELAARDKVSNLEAFHDEVEQEARIAFGSLEVFLRPDDGGNRQTTSVPRLDFIMALEKLAGRLADFDLEGIDAEAGKLRGLEPPSDLAKDFHRILTLIEEYDHATALDATKAMIAALGG